MEELRYTPEEELNLKLVIALLRSRQHQKQRESDLLKPYSLTLPQFGVLEVLYHKGDMRVCDIVEKTLSSNGNMTVVINNLLKEGLITRYRDPEDKRAYIVQLSSEGLKLIREIFPEHLANLNQDFSHMTMDEKHQLLHLLKRLNHLA